jgi:polar amino acid transport system substrate-binding protein
MKTLQQIWSSYYKAQFRLTKRTTILFAVLLLILGFGVRSCFFSPPPVKHLYRIARDNTWYPLDLQGKEKNMQAFTNELFLAIAKMEGFQLEIINSDAPMVVLNQGMYDGVLSALSPDSTNQDKYYFSDPFYLLGPILVVRSTSNINSLQQMKGKTIGVMTGSSLSFNLDKYPSLLITSYDNVIAALHDVELDLIDGVVLDRFIAYAYTTGIYAKKLKIVSVPLTNKGLRVVTRHEPDYEEFIKRFDAGLKETKRSGLYDQLLIKWNLPRGPEDESTDNG